MSRFKLSIAAAALLLTVLAAIFYWSRTDSFDERIRQLEEAGEPVRPADLARDPIPDDVNAWTHLRPVQMDIASIETAIDAIVQNDYRGDHWSADEVKRLEAVLAGHAALLAAIDRALACDDFDEHVNYNVDGIAFMAQPRPELSVLRSIARIQMVRASLFASRGQDDDAAAAALSIHRLARFAERMRHQVGFSVGCAIRSAASSSLAAAVPRATITGETRAAIERQIAADDSMLPFVDSLRGERAVGLDTFKAMRNMYGGVMRLAWWVDWDGRDYIEQMQHQIDLGAAPDYKTAAKVTAYDAAHGDPGPITKLLMPALDAARVAMDRTRAEMRCVRVLNALYGGNYDPAKDAPAIDSLGLPAEAITDPFTGDWLTIKSDGPSWIVYSFGLDRVDDGGNIEYPSPRDLGVRATSTRPADAATTATPIVAP